MRVYLSEEFIGALVYYFAKHDMFRCEVKRIEEIKKKFVDDGNEEFGCGAISVYFSKEDAMKFCETHSNVLYNPLTDSIMISEDFDFAVMDNCKRYLKKFKKYGDWARLKKAVKFEKVYAWLIIFGAPLGALSFYKFVLTKAQSCYKITSDVTVWPYKKVLNRRINIMVRFEAEGVLGALIYLSTMSDKFQITFCEVLDFNKNFIEACNKASKINKAECTIMREDVVRFCLEHSDILAFDNVTNSIYVKRDMRSVVLDLYGYTMYIAGSGARIIFNDVFNSMFKKVLK